VEGYAGRCGVDGLMHPGPFGDVLFEARGKIGAVEWGRNGLCSSPIRMAPSRMSRRRLTMIALDFSAAAFGGVALHVPASQPLFADGRRRVQMGAEQ
jgi:hypothetical protein